MLRVLIAWAVALAAVSGGLAPGHGSIGPLAFVSVEDASQLVAVDLDTKRVVTRIHVPRSPHNVAAAGRLVLVTSPPAGAVTLVDAPSRRVLHLFSGLVSPHDVEISPSGRFAYVTEERAGRIAVLDLRTRRLVARTPVGTGPHDLAISPNGRRIWVTHGPHGRSPTILDATDPARPKLVAYAGGGGEHDIAFDRRGLFVWVTYWDSGSVGASIVGQIRAYPRTGRLRRQERVGLLVHHVYVDTAGRVWATDHLTGDVYLIGEMVRRVFSGCPGAHHVALAGTTRVVVACHDANAIAVYDTATGRRTMIPVGAGPHGVAVVLAR